jgi:DNA polymerase-3 subunit gamma/tau
MSYQVLARKWRPRTFREMVGQEHVLKALINALDHNRLHHAYLFTGTRGVGKTTIARILAKCLNCEAGVSSEPCGSCNACMGIAEGRFIDLIEVDAASRTKVEDTRELLENVQYAPTAGRYKVYLIDEVHMLSTHSFNALLKTLEEPPPHVKFLLATTDPQKLPATILSRCLQFNLKNMTPERIVGHLQHVLDKEMVTYEEQALWQLGRAADGSMRDALSLTDQAIAFGSGKLSDADVGIMLGSIDQSAIQGVLQALAAADGAQVLSAVRLLSEHAPDFAAALEQLLSLLHRVAIAQAVPDAIDNSFGDADQIAQLAKQLAAEDVQLFYQIALNGRRDLPLAPDPRSGFEMVLLRMLAFKPAGVYAVPQSALNNTKSSVANTEAPTSIKKPEPAKQERAALVPSNTVAAQVESQSNKIPANEASLTPKAQSSTESALVGQMSSKTEPVTAPVEELTPEVEKIERPEASAVEAPGQNQSRSEASAHQSADTAKSAQTPQRQSTPVSASVGETGSVKSDNEPLTLADITTASWTQLFERLGFGGVVGNIASHCVLERVADNQLYFLLDAANATLFNDGYTQRIEQHLTVTLNALVKVNINVASVSDETPAMRKERLIKESKQQALTNMNSDPNIQCLISDFDAELDIVSVQPL